MEPSKIRKFKFGKFGDRLGNAFFSVTDILEAWNM